MRFVIADDSRPLRLLIRRVLEEEGYQVVGEAENAVSALAICQRLKPDFAIIDITMPPGDGAETALACIDQKLVRKVLIQSSNCEDSTFDPLKAKGAKLLAKPYHAHELIGSVKSLVGGS